MYMTLIIMWYQRVCNCCFDLVRSHQCSTAYMHVHVPFVPWVYVLKITQSMYNEMKKEGRREQARFKQTTKQSNNSTPNVYT